ncbi:TolC family protein [uncultured Draconibacterium sp.]|uniref:TolC family protein n=1 Tax=uncultured Draconibacterium sp. TaxID=1573823 RepID=UPI0032601346
MKNIYLSLLLIMGLSLNTLAQEEMVLTLPDVIDLASKQSIDAFRNKNMYLASYWEYRFYKAERLPSISLSANPLDFNRYRNKEYNFETNEDEFRLREYFNSEVAVSAVQNVTLTGGQVFLRSELGMVKNLGGDKKTSYNATPISIGFQQELNGYNRLKWESKIEPLKFEKAKKEFIQDMEDLRVTSTIRFFGLINAQIQKNIAEMNYANADTLYKIGKGRFQVGTVTQDELLELELRLLNNEQALNIAQLDEKRAQARLNSFLGLPKETLVKCIVPSEIPALQINPDEAISEAIKNNPEILGHQQQKLQQDENVAEAKSERGLNTTLFAMYGLNQSAEDFDQVYVEPDKSQRFSLGLNIPIVDWGRGKGRYSMAKSNREVALATIKQERIDFEQDIYQSVLEFNLQAGQVYTAAKADTVAKMGYDVTFQRFLIGKIDVIKLNIASNDQETARMSYLSQLRDYWAAYYRLRSLTLFDFEQRKPLVADYNKLLEN